MVTLASGFDPISIAVGLVVSAAFSVGASLLSGSLNRQSKVADNSPPTLTERGSPLPMLLGRRRLPGFLCWAGDRRSVTTSGGKGLFGGGGGGQTTYSERGWHVLCVGPVYAIHGIFESGKSIWSGTLTRSDSSSGTHIHTRKGDAYIYWGEFDQDANATLASKLGTSSTWPCICYIFWDRKKLGSQTQWPQVEYEISVRIEDPVLEDSAPWMEELEEGDGTDGPNPAHVLWQLLTAPAPYGCAIPPDRLSFEAFEALGALLEQEHQSCHVLSGNGLTGADVVAQLLQDLGVMLPQIGDLLVPKAIRHVDAESLPLITQDMMVVPAPPPRQQAHEAALPDRLTFVIKDRTNNYRDMDLVVDDDSQALLRNRTKQQRVDIATAIDRRTGLLVAKRREQEMLTNTEKYSMELARGARLLQAGDAFLLDGYGQMRVISNEPAVPGRRAKIEAVIDQYSGEPGTYVPADIDDTFGAVAASAEPDTLVVVQELPAAITSKPAVGVMRIRASAEISGASVWMSGDGVSYSLVGTQDTAAAGGTLNSAMAADGPWIIEQGPVISAYNDDIANVIDLSGNEDAWRSGAQVAVIQDEYFYLRNVTAVLGGWRLDGLIRARFDTDRAAHASGAPVLIMQSTSLKVITSSLIRDGKTVYVKTQPSTSSDEADLSAVTAVSLVIGSPRALRPLPPDNFLCNRGTRINEYSSGDDLVFTWTYRVKDGAGRAAGEVAAGVKISRTKPKHEGVFRIELFDVSNVLQQTLEIDNDTGTATYSNSDLITDFGGEPATLTAKLTNASGAYDSTVRTITINKR